MRTAARAAAARRQQPALTQRMRPILHGRMVRAVMSRLTVAGVHGPARKGLAARRAPAPPRAGGVPCALASNFTTAHSSRPCRRSVRVCARGSERGRDATRPAGGRSRARARLRSRRAGATASRSCCLTSWARARGRRGAPQSTTSLASRCAAQLYSSYARPYRARAPVMRHAPMRAKLPCGKAPHPPARSYPTPRPRRSP